MLIVNNTKFDLGNKIDYFPFVTNFPFKDFNIVITVLYLLPNKYKNS